MAYHISSDHDLHPDELISEINMIPLVDIMLVLLIIFMVAAPLSLSGIDVRVPEVSSSSSQSLSQEQKIIISVRQDGAVFFDDQPVNLDDLPGLLKGRDEGGLKASVMIQADKNVAYAQVVDVMNHCQSAGFHRIGLVVSSSPVR